jgi:hypothetical protein
LWGRRVERKEGIFVGCVWGGGVVAFRSGRGLL